MVIRLLALLFFLFIGSLFSVESLMVEDVMNDVEQEDTGLNRLSPQQKAAFERWISSWTIRVIQQSASYHSSESLRSWIKTWPAYLQPHQPSKEEAIKSRREANQRVFRNFNGKLLVLRDGSEWNICTIDQPAVRWWQRGQQILISKAERDTVRPYIFKNTGISDPGMAQAGGTMAHQSDPSGQRPQDPPSYFHGSVILESLRSDGLKTVITTSDHTTYSVAPMDEQIVSTIWRAHDRLRIEKSSDAVYKWKITNLDSGDSTVATKE